jgi:hypothetical protein
MVCVSFVFSWRFPILFQRVVLFLRVSKSTLQSKVEPQTLCPIVLFWLCRVVRCECTGKLCWVPVLKMVCCCCCFVVFVVFVVVFLLVLFFAASQTEILKAGCVNVRKHIQNICTHYGTPVVVAITRPSGNYCYDVVVVVICLFVVCWLFLIEVDCR